MAIQLPVVNAAANDTFQIFIDKLNGVINTIANSVITANTNANGATTTGNAFIIGIAGATTHVANTMRGGNVQSSANLTITSNTLFTGAILMQGANVTVNNSSVVIGANVVMTDSLLSYGNSTINAVINSTSIVVGPNSTLTGTSLSIGNSTINAVVNTTGVSISGAAMPLANNKAAVAVNGTLVGTGTRINFSGSGSATVSATVDAGNSQVNVVVSSSLVLAGGAGGTNTNLLFNDSSTIGGTNGFVFDKTTNIATIANTLNVGGSIVNSSIFFTGNSTVNAVSNSTVDSFANSTVTTTYGIGGLNIGGLNIVNTSVFFSGNSTINAVSNSTVDTFSNSSITTSYGIGGVSIGANVVIGPSGPSYGNSTINAVVNSTAMVIGAGGMSVNAISLTLGANLVVNNSFFLLGNTTVSWTGNSTQIQLANSTIAHIITPGSSSIGANVSITYQSVTVGTTVINATAVSAAAYVGSGIATTTNYFANNAGKVMTSDVLNNSGAYVTLTDAATIAVDMSTGINFAVTMAGNRTLGNPTNVVVGRSGVIKVIEDATGGRTLSFGANYIFDSDVAPVIGTGANKVNFLFYHCATTSAILLTLAAKSV